MTDIQVTPVCCPLFPVSARSAQLMQSAENDRMEKHPAKTEYRTSLTDETLLSRIAGGDRAAFHTLYEQSSSAVYGYALSLLRSREDAEDVMQETFVKVCRSAHLYRPMGKPMAWILAICRNECMTHLRGQKRHIALADAADAVPSWSSAVSDHEDRLVLETAMQILTEQEREIVMLHAVGGLKHREIGAMLGLPLPTVLSKYHRSMAKLRRQLEERHELEQQ